MEYLFLLFLLFNNVILSKLPFFNIVNYWDELAFFVIVFLGLLFSKKNSSKKTLKRVFFDNYFILIIIITFGLFGNLIFNYAFSVNSIIRDIVNFLKFPLSLLILININSNNNYSIEKCEKIKKDNLVFGKIIKAIIIIIFFFGIVSIFFDIGMSQNEIRNGIEPYQFLYSHPTILVLNCVFLLALLETTSSKKNIFIYRLMILFTVILTMRTKGIVFVSLYIFITYFGNKLRKFKLIYFVLGSVLVIAFSYSKLKLYSSFSSSPREVLYLGSLKLLLSCFPFGSGFGTFASHISARYFSRAYSFIDLPSFYFDNSSYLLVFGDAGYPYYIAQFGLFGLILFFILLYNIYRLLTKDIKDKNGIILIMIYILIALTSESTLINFGIELSFLLFYVYKVNLIKGGNYK